MARSMIDFASLRTRLEADYAGLSPQLRGAARYALKEPGFIALYPLRRVAQRAGVSPATFVRLAKHLGFGSYNGLRDVFREGMHSGAARYATDAHQLLSYKGGRGFERAWNAAGQVQVRNITEMMASIPPAAVEAAGLCLAKARRIFILGLRSNYAPAFYFHYVLRTFLRNAILLEDRMGMLIDELGDIGPKDALVALSADPYAIEAVKAVEYAAAAGCPVISLTDHKLSPIAGPATHVFLVPNASASFYHSMVPKMVLLESLVCLLVARGGRAAVDRVKAEFERRESFGIYWSDKGRG
jgi:DNA-binding MurR/RpiR family transcriptional regulator